MSYPLPHSRVDSFVIISPYLRFVNTFFKSSVNYKLLIVIEQIELWKEMLTIEGSIIYNFLESLILAQDERWRRA